MSAITDLPAARIGAGRGDGGAATSNVQWCDPDRHHLEIRRCIAPSTSSLSSA